MSALNAVEKGAAAVGAHLVRDVSLPALVLHRDALEHNIRWMQAFVSNSGAQLAPHGKTSMMPALFHRQIEQGAWGITLANAVQTRAAYAGGIRRVLMANQLVGAEHGVDCRPAGRSRIRLPLHGRPPGQRGRPGPVLRRPWPAFERDDRIRCGWR